MERFVGSCTAFMLPSGACAGGGEGASEAVVKTEIEFAAEGLSALKAGVTDTDRLNHTWVIPRIAVLIFSC